MYPVDEHGYPTAGRGRYPHMVPLAKLERAEAMAAAMARTLRLAREYVEDPRVVSRIEERLAAYEASKEAR